MNLNFVILIKNVKTVVFKCHTMKYQIILTSKYSRIIAYCWGIRRAIILGHRSNRFHIFLKTVLTLSLQLSDHKTNHRLPIPSQNFTEKIPALCVVT